MKLNDLFVYELRSLLEAENLILKVISKISETAASDRLSNLLNEYSSDIEQHIQRNELAFQITESPIVPKKSEAMEALLAEAKEVMNEFAHTPQLDAALILAVQKIVHYKIVGYGSLLTWARLLDFVKISDLMEQNLLEEKDTDTTLSNLAENEINAEAFSK